MAESTNIFSEGMNQDVSRLSMSKTQYYSATNMRVATDVGQSMPGISNIKGNSFSFEIPRPPRVFRIDEDSIPLTSVTNAIFTIDTTFGTTQVSFSYSVNTFTEFLEETVRQFEADSFLSNYQVRTAFLDNNSLIVWLDDPTSNIDSITFSTTGGTLSISVYADTVNIPVVIGSTTIRESIIIFTAQDDLIISDSGQIWEVTYNTADEASVRLVYHGPVRFSPNHPIEAIGIYENISTRRVYWTDYNNSVRSLNVADPNAMGIPVDSLELLPSISFSKPVYGGVFGGGSLKSGMYWYAYRLKGRGIVSRFSPLSQAIHIVASDEASSVYWKFEANQYFATIPATATNKSVRIEFINLDTRYDIIEVAAIYKEDPTSTPVVTLIEESPLQSQDNFSIVHTGSESETDMSIDEFLFLGVNFDTAKTLAVKDSRLLLGNVKTSEFIDSEFNARAYRWTAAPGPTTYISDINVDPFDSATSQIDKDAINPYNLDPTSTPYIYQSDGITIGGEGPNVKYKFIKQKIEGDTSHSYKNNANQAQFAPFVNKGKTSTNLDNLDECFAQQPIHWRDYKNPLYNGYVKGYMRGEVYRFGIVLFDKKGRPGFVNWIGDIRFPEYWFPDADLTGTGHNDFQLYKKNGDPTAGTNLQYGNALGIEFEVTLPPTILNNISGYAIVRVERDINNRTRLGTGMIQRTASTRPLSPAVFGEDVHFIPWLGLNFDSTMVGEGDHIVMYSPEFLHNGHPVFNSGDRLVVYAVSEEAPGHKDATGMQPFTEYYKIWDQVDIDAATTRFQSIEDTARVPKGQTHQFNGEDKFINYAYDVMTDDIYSIGNDCLYILMDADYEPYNPHAGGDNIVKSFVAYERVLSEQYGGATESARAQNTYIACNNFIRIDENSTSTQTFKVFGGDTYITFYGNTNLEKNVQDVIDNHINEPLYPEAVGDATMTGFFFPIETTSNNDVRTGYHLANKADPSSSFLFPDVSVGGLEAFDQYNAKDVYSFTNDDTIVFIPKPTTVEFQNEFDNRVYASNVKINGEMTDSWRVFTENTYIDVDGIYGPINKLIRFQDNIYYFQDSGFGRLSINPSATVTTLEGAATELGSGGVLHDFQYISTSYGTRHQWSVIATDSAIYWYDVLNKKIMRLAGDGDTPLSDIKGMSSYVANTFTGRLLHFDNPLLHTGVTVAHDRRFNEVYFTFRDTVEEDGEERLVKATLVYSEVIGNFTSFYSHTPVLYINTRDRILSPSPLGDNWNKIYIHNIGNYGEFYGETNSSLLTLIANEAAPISKTFDNISWHSEVYEDQIGIFNRTWTRGRFSNDYQNTDWYDLIPTDNIRRVFREWNMILPRDSMIPGSLSAGRSIFDLAALDRGQQFKGRLKDKHLRIDFEFENSDNQRFICNYIKSYFRKSS